MEKRMNPEDVIGPRGEKLRLFSGASKDILGQMAAGADTKIQCVITDPPYLHPNLGGGGCFKESNKKVVGSNEELAAICASYDMDTMFTLWKELGAENVVTFCSNLQIADTIRQMEKHDYRYTVCVWHKYNACPMTNNTFMPDAEYFIIGRQKGAYFNNDVPTSYKQRVRRRPMENARRFHPTAKPVGLIFELVELLAAPDGVVLDPFLGSGTTGLACLQSHKDFVGIELNPDYYAKAAKIIKEDAEQEGLF
jgi:hypothetical protein